MALSDDLGPVSERAKQAMGRAAAAKAQAREQLERAVQTAGDDTEQTANKVHPHSAATADKADALADNMKRSWNEHLSQARARHDDRKAPHAADRAEADAGDAEAYASYSIDFAYSAIEEAEYVASPARTRTGLCRRQHLMSVAAD